MFELDEVQSHTPSLSSSLQAVCLCAWLLGRLCFFFLLLCVKADNRLSSPHGSLSAWALSSPHGFFVCAELQVISGNTLNYLMLHSTRKGRISNFLHTVYGYVYFIYRLLEYPTSDETKWQLAISPAVLSNILLKYAIRYSICILMKGLTWQHQKQF